MDSKRNRKFERTDFSVKGFVSSNGEETPLTVINISLKGVLVKSDKDIAQDIGTRMPLRVCLPNSDISIRTEAALVHRDGDNLGFRFDSIDADGMIHLRRLMELNVTSESEIERELAFLGD